MSPSPLMPDDPGHDLNKLRKLLADAQGRDPAAHAEVVKHLTDLIGKRMWVLAAEVLPAFKNGELTDESAAIVRVCLKSQRDSVTATQPLPRNPDDYYAQAAECVRLGILMAIRSFWRQREVLAGHGTPGNGQPVQATPDDNADQRAAARRSRFHEAVETLPPQQRQAVNLIWYLDLPSVVAFEVVREKEPALEEFDLEGRYDDGIDRLMDADWDQSPEPG